MLFGKYSRLPFLLDADDGKGGGGDPPAGDPPANDDKPKTWDAYVESLSDDVKELYTTHVSGLKNALTSERETNKETAAKLKRLEELEEADKKRKEEQMTEMEKLQAQVAERDQKYADLQAQIDQERDQFNSERIKSAVKLAAKDLGFADPGDAYNLADITGVEIDDESGEIKGVEDALKKLSDAKPYLLEQEKGPRIGNNTRGKNGKRGKITEPEKITDKKGPLVRL